MRIVVTGASGFVGRPTCQSLSAAGHEVTAVVRTARSAAGLTAHEVTPLGDLSGATDWSSVLARADAVVHLAAKTHARSERTETAQISYRQANVEVTRALAEAALRAGVRRFVFVSSIKVNGESTSGVPFTAQMPPAPADWYGRTKAEAEATLFDLAANAFEAVVLRPPLMYGPGLKGNMALLFAMADRVIPMPFASIANARDVLSVQSFADLITRVVSHPAAAGRVFLARDGTPVSTPRLFAAIARALDRPARMLPVPVGLLRLAGKATGRSAEIERLVGDLEIDDGATRKVLGWTPPTGMENALAETAKWWRERAAHSIGAAQAQTS
jgi:UDP-N-acetyl-alpha-D-quinovosamine dehydrogenase